MAEDNQCAFYTQRQTRCSKKVSCRETKTCTIHTNGIIDNGYKTEMIKQIETKYRILERQKRHDLYTLVQRMPEEDRTLIYREGTEQIEDEITQAKEAEIAAIPDDAQPVPAAIVTDRQTKVEEKRQQREEERAAAIRAYEENQARINRENEEFDRNLATLPENIRQQYAHVTTYLQTIGYRTRILEHKQRILQRIQENRIPDLKAYILHVYHVNYYTQDDIERAEGRINYFVDRLRREYDPTGRLYPEEDFTPELRLSIRNHILAGWNDDRIHRHFVDKKILERRRRAENARALRDQANRVANLVGGIVDRLRPRHVGEVGRFAADTQNIHTTPAVEHTKKMVEKILKIEVPKEYQWNKNVCSITPGEIIIHCKLKPEAAMQMQTKYCKGDNIYEMGRGIYGKVLDGVWQFIQKSDDKESLYKILKTEMEDNIGMCEQGNLTRLCNILSGYMEGMAPPESLNEKLGRLFADLAKEKHTLDKKKDLGKAILKENKVAEAEWEVWLDALE